MKFLTNVAIGFAIFYVIATFVAYDPLWFERLALVGPDVRLAILALATIVVGFVGMWRA